MKKNLVALAVPLFFSIGMTAGPALAGGNSNRLFIDRDVDTFAVLPDGVRFPEGITANPANGDIYVATFDGGNQNKLLRYSRNGHLVASHDFGITPLLGLEFDRAHDKVYVLNVGDFVGAESKIQRIAADFNGARGLVFDRESGLLWVCANQAYEVVALNANGRIVAKLGEFRGINRDGTPDGLLFPASLVIVGDEIFVTNLAIALTPAVGDEPEEDVTRWTVSRMRLPHRED